MKAIVLVISKRVIGQISKIELAFQKSEQVQMKLNHAKDQQYLNLDFRIHRG